MSKKPFRYLCFSLLILTAACAPGPKITPPPPVYTGEDLSLDEVISEAGDEIHILKAIADIRIRKDGRPYDSVNASVLLKSPGQVHMRIYKFGMLVRDFIIKGDDLYVLSGKSTDRLRDLGSEFYNAVFWWEDIQDGLMKKTDKKYIVLTGNREIHLDRATLLPLAQKLDTFDGTIYIAYGNPSKTGDDFWYPSEINIDLKRLSFRVELKKILRNPELGESDFRVPGEW